MKKLYELHYSMLLCFFSRVYFLFYFGNIMFYICVMAYLTNVIDFHFFASHNVVYLVGQLSVLLGFLFLFFTFQCVIVCLDFGNIVEVSGRD
jgi:hypothetical protein